MRYANKYLKTYGAQSMSDNKIRLDYSACEEAALHMCNILVYSASTKFDTVIALQRGGLFGAMLAQRWLQIPNMICLPVESYDGEESKQVRVNWGKLSVEDVTLLDSPETLVVDDIYDTGRTFKHIQTYLPQAHYGCLMGRRQLYQNGSDETAVGAWALPGWVIFPWETHDNSVAIKKLEE